MNSFTSTSTREVDRTKAKRSRRGGRDLELEARSARESAGAVLLDLVGIASEGEKVSTNSDGIIEVGGPKGKGKGVESSVVGWRGFWPLQDIANYCEYCNNIV